MPKSVKEVQEAVVAAQDAHDALRIVGGGTLDGIGGTVVASREIHLTALSGIVQFEPGDLTIGALAGTSLGELSTILAPYRLTTPLDAPHPERATLGGTLSGGWLGPRRHHFGRPRDAVIGTQTVLADGRTASAGGMVVKNVTGYDLSKLYIGSFGTLGIITRANLKLQPTPTHARALFASLPEHTCLRSMQRIQGLAAYASAALLIDGFHREIDGDDGSDGRIFVLLESSQDVLETGTREIRGALGQAGIPEASIIDHGPRDHLQRVINAGVATIGDRSITYRTLGDPIEHHNGLLALRDRLSSLSVRTESMLDIFNGDFFLRVSDRDTRAFAGKLADIDDVVHGVVPRAIVVACTHELRDQLQIWGAHPAAIEKMKHLKHAFDPNNLLNPGRFLLDVNYGR